MDQQLSFARDIRPLFRDRDIGAMSSMFDLASYEDVLANADGIYEQLAAGSMPCDGPWPADDVERFRAWVEAGAQP